MSRQWVWSAFLGIVVMLSLVGWGLHQERSPNLVSSSVSNGQPTVTSIQTPPLVDAERLMADLVTFSFERFTETDRNRARDTLRQSLETAGWLVQSQAFNHGINLYAERPGTDPTAGTILLAAHYDSVERSPGADDNATAVATVLEAARLLREQPTPRTLQLALFDLEETGLEGSTAFAEKIASDDLRGVIVMDMLGYACETAGCQTYPPLPITPPTDRGNFLAVIGDRGNPALIRSFEQSDSTELPPVLSLAIPTFERLTPDMMRSDHVPFWRKGIGAVLVTDTANFRNPHYHQPSDTVETIDPAFFVGAAQRVINAITTLLHQVE